MQHTLHYIKLAAGTALVAGITLVAGSTMNIRAQLSSNGATLAVPAHIERLLPHASETMHAAAPGISADAGVPQAQLLLGMLLILAGFGLSLAFVRAERSVRITVKHPKRKHVTKKRRTEVREWIWMRMEV